MKHSYCLILLLISISAHSMLLLKPSSIIIPSITPTLTLPKSTVFNKLLNHENIFTQKLLYKYALVNLFTKHPYLNIKKFINDATLFKGVDNPSARFDLFIKSSLFHATLSHASLIEDNLANKCSVILAQTPITLGTAMYYSAKHKANIPEIYCVENLTDKPEYPEISARFEKLLAQG